MRRSLFSTLAASATLTLATQALAQSTTPQPAPGTAPAPMMRQPVAGAAAAAPGKAVAALPPAAPSHRGFWSTEGGKSQVEVSDCAPGICARIVWLKDPNDEKGQPLYDGYNKDRQLRARPILGIPLFERMLPVQTGWQGRVYSPEEGQSYDVTVWLSSPDKLSIKGCVLFVCQTHNWTRAVAAAPTATAAPAVPAAAAARPPGPPATAPR